MLLRDNKLILGLVHLHPMPGTPFYMAGDEERSLDKALRDVEALQRGGADGCLLQTVDKVYQSGDDTDYARVACMAVIAGAVRRAVGPDFRLGVQIMWNCITPSLAAAKASGADFVRCTALCGSVPSPYGTVTGDPFKVLGYRRQIDAEDVALVAEISGYHTRDEGGYSKERLLSSGFDAVTAGAAALEVVHRDEAVNRQMVLDIKAAFPNIPVILGGGTDVENCARRLREADGALVGSCFEGGNWGGDVDVEIVRRYVDQVREMEASGPK